MLFDPSNKLVYVSEYEYGNETFVINNTTVLTSIALGLSHCYTFLYDQVNGYVYIGCTVGGEVVINNTNEVADIPIGLPTSAAYDASNGLVYVASAASLGGSPGGNGVLVINGTKAQAYVTTSPRPDSVLYDPSNGYVYVSNTEYPGGCFNCGPYDVSDNVTIISGQTVLENVTVGKTPGLLLYDPSYGGVYVFCPNGIYNIYAASQTSSTSTASSSSSSSLTSSSFSSSLTSSVSASSGTSGTSSISSSSTTSTSSTSSAGPPGSTVIVWGGLLVVIAAAMIVGYVLVKRKGGPGVT